MKLNAIKLTAIVLIMASPVFVLAQHNHGGQSQGSNEQAHEHATPHPHGGEVKDAGKYHIEMVADMLLKEAQVSFYLLKGAMKSVSNEGITGTVQYKYKDESTVTETLKPKGDDGFSAELKRKEPFYCIVAFLIKGKTVSTVFNYEGMSGSHKGHNH